MPGAHSLSRILVFVIYIEKNILINQMIYHLYHVYSHSLLYRVSIKAWF